MQRSRFLLGSGLFAVASVLGACGDDEPVFPPDPPPDPEAQIEPAPGGMRRLTARQYIASVRVLLGDAAAAAAAPPSDASLFGLEAIAARELASTPGDVEKYELSARKVAEAAVADDDSYEALVPCQPANETDEACLAEIAESFGRLAWRRALAQDEIDDLVAAAKIAAAEYDLFEEGVEALVSATLQAPDFLYLVEVGEPDPDGAARRRLLPSELAARMSFFLAGETPDASLLDRADSGELDDEVGIRALALELVARPEARASLADFYAEIFKLRDFSAVQKDTEQFPEFDDATRVALVEETKLLLEDIIWTRDTDARELFVASWGYVNQDNAWIYGVSSSNASFVRTEVPGRAGLLSQASILARFAHPGLTSPTRRGVFVQTVLLCNTIPPPPPDVTPIFPPDDGVPKTMKQRMEQHQKDDSCAGCHSLVDPIGFALENFDAAGAFRSKDQGLPIDATGSVEDLGAFDGVAELGALLHDNPEATDCMARQLFRQSMGHLESTGELPALDRINEAFEAEGFRIQKLLVEIAASEAFRLVGEPK